MKGFVKTVANVSGFLNVIAGTGLILLMTLTIADVILRAFFNKPILGTYEMVGLIGAVVIGFSMPQTAALRGHIYVDSFIALLPRTVRNIFNVGTRLLVISLLGMIGWNLFKFAGDLQKSGEVSLTLQIPFYPFVYGIGICCLVQCLVMVCDIIKIFGGTFDE
jgi:TRAP-type C4-dicarboxylate transport system permease small subunit